MPTIEAIEEVHFGNGSVVFAVAHLPNYEEAWIPLEKLKAYVLNPEHLSGRDKAYVFASQLAIRNEDWPYLHRQIIDGLPESPAILRADGSWGVKWEVPILVAGRNECSCFVSTAWIIRPDIPKPQLTSARVAKRNEVPRLLAVREAFSCALVEARAGPLQQPAACAA